MANLEVVFYDDDIIVLDKPPGLLSVPGRGADKQDCLVSRARIEFPHILEQPAVHRLDMDTSGLMVLAVNKDSHRTLSSQFATRSVAKKYVALLAGCLAEDEGRIELAFRLDVANRPYQIFDPIQGKFGITLWYRMGLEGNHTRVEFVPLTGRTHQLRVHAAHELGLNCPIVGDCLYGVRRGGQRMMLHATELSFTHPTSGKQVSFCSPVPF